MVKLYFLPVTAEDGVSEQMYDLLSDRRREALYRRRPPEDKKLGLYASLLARAVLCKILDVGNSALVFAEHPNGKPYLQDHDVFFNVSHTKSAIAVAVGTKEVGVDVEKIGSVREKIARRHFTAAEQEYMADDPDRRFFEIWTRKEAFVKRSGRGLSEPFGSFCTLSGDAAACINTFMHDGYAISVCTDEPEVKLIDDAETAAILDEFLQNRT